MIEYIVMCTKLYLLIYMLLIPQRTCFLRSPSDVAYQYKAEVNVNVIEGRRTKRSTDNSFHPQFYELDFIVEGSSVHLHLIRNENLQTHVPTLSLQHDVLIARAYNEVQETSYYQDDKTGSSFIVQFDNQGSSNMLGIFATRHGEYIMQTSTTNSTFIYQELHQFEIIKMIPRHVNFNDFLDIGDSLKNLKYQHRQKRATGAHQIELLIVCDYAVYKYWYDRSSKSTAAEKEQETLITIRQFYAFIINGMDAMYKNIQTSSYTISIVFAGIVIVQSPQNSAWTEAIKITSVSPNQVDSSNALTSFSTWVQSTPGLPENDHAMLFTRYDLTSSGSTSNAGLAYLGKTCKPTSQSIVEDGFDFIMITVASHELGHSLSAAHDGDRNGCSPSDAFIMAASSFPQVSSGTASHPWIFSSCSTSYFTSYINSLDAAGENCMKTVSLKFDPTALFPYDKSLAGQIYDADAQCRHLYGSNSYMCREQYNNNYASICSVLWCYDPNTASSICISHIAGEGTLCGSKKWCESGVCTSNINAPDGDDNCLYGDRKGVIISNYGWTCVDIIVNSPIQCSLNQPVSQQCCSSCAPKTTSQTSTTVALTSTGEGATTKLTTQQIMSTTQRQMTTESTTLQSQTSTQVMTTQPETTHAITTLPQTTTQAVTTSQPQTVTKVVTTTQPSTIEVITTAEPQTTQGVNRTLTQTTTQATSTLQQQTTTLTTTTLQPQTTPAVTSTQINTTTQTATTSQQRTTTPDVPQPVTRSQEIKTTVHETAISTKTQPEPNTLSKTTLLHLETTEISISDNSATEQEYILIGVGTFVGVLVIFSIGMCSLIMYCRRLKKLPKSSHKKLSNSYSRNDMVNQGLTYDETSSRDHWIYLNGPQLYMYPAFNFYWREYDDESYSYHSAWYPQYKTYHNGGFY